MEGPGRTRANAAGDTMDRPGSMTEDKQSPVAGLCKHTRRQAQNASGQVLQNFAVVWGSLGRCVMFERAHGQISHH